MWSGTYPLKAELVSTSRRAKATSEVELTTKCRPFELAEYPILPIYHLHAATGSDRPAEPSIPHGIAPDPEAAHPLILDAQTTTCVQRHRSAGIGAAEIPASDRRWRLAVQTRRRTDETSGHGWRRLVNRLHASRGVQQHSRRRSRTTREQYTQDSGDSRAGLSRCANGAKPVVPQHAFAPLPSPPEDASYGHAGRRPSILGFVARGKERRGSRHAGGHERSTASLHRKIGSVQAGGGDADDVN
jgi:hypothetical protein